MERRAANRLADKDRDDEERVPILDSSQETKVTVVEARKETPEEKERRLRAHQNVEHWKEATKDAAVLPLGLRQLVVGTGGQTAPPVVRWTPCSLCCALFVFLVVVAVAENVVDVYKPSIILPVNDRQPFPDASHKCSYTRGSELAADYVLTPNDKAIMAQLNTIKYIARILGTTTTLRKGSHLEARRHIPPMADRDLDTYMITPVGMSIAKTLKCAEVVVQFMSKKNSAEHVHMLADCMVRPEELSFEMYWFGPHDAHTHNNRGVVDQGFMDILNVPCPETYGGTMGTEYYWPLQSALMQGTTDLRVSYTSEDGTYYLTADVIVIENSLVTSQFYNLRKSASGLSPYDHFSSLCTCQYRDIEVNCFTSADRYLTEVYDETFMIPSDAVNSPNSDQWENYRWWWRWTGLYVIPAYIKEADWVST